MPNAVKRTRNTWRKIPWSKLPRRSSGLREISRCLQKGKWNTWGETQEECVFLATRKIIGSNMGENSYASVARRVDKTNQDNKYRTLVEKLIQLEANEWPKFQEHQKILHSAEFYQAPAQQRVGNRERSNVVVQTKTHVGPTAPTRTTSKISKSLTKQLLHKSPIRLPKSIKNRLKKLVSHKIWTT